jgi:hypothetical protein
MPIEYFVPGLWPKKRFNLICGSSASGKTRWMLPRLIELHKAGFYVMYTCCDRSVDDARDTLVSMGYPANALPMESFQNEDESLPFSFEGLKLLIKGHRFSAKKPIDIVFVESIGVLAEDMNNAKAVVEFSRQINALMASEGLSVWGSSWCAKVKKNAEFVKTRDNVMGSAAWPGICGTIVYIDTPEDDTSSERRVTIMPRNAVMSSEDYKFDEMGRLLPFAKGSLDDLLKGGGTIYRSDVEAQCERMGISTKTGERWVRRKFDEGKLKLVRRGEYLVIE